jgi:hypothetical protein
MYNVNENIDKIFTSFKISGLLKEDESNTTIEPETSSGKPDESTTEIKNDKEDNNTPGIALRKVIEPERDSVQLILQSINSSFDKSYNGLRKYKPFAEQFKAWEKQVKGACDSIMNKVKQNAFDPSDTNACSPMAYNVLADSTNRDVNMLELCGACIIFYNSLK